MRVLTSFSVCFLQLYGFSMISEFGLGPTIGKSEPLLNDDIIHSLVD